MLDLRPREGDGLCFAEVIGSDHAFCTCHGEREREHVYFRLQHAFTPPKDESGVVLTGWACCVMAGRNV